MISSIDISDLKDLNMKRRSMVHAMVRAKVDYTKSREGELSFLKGQHFTVIPGHQEVEYYEVVNPDTKEKGLVKVKMMEYYAANNQVFYQLKQNNQLINQINTENVLNNTNGNKDFKQRIGFALTTIKNPQMGFMEINKDDALLIIDQSEDYYIAKPIGKLGIPAKILIKDVLLQQVFNNENNNNNNNNNKSISSTIPNKILEKIQPLPALPISSNNNNNNNNNNSNININNKSTHTKVNLSISSINKNIINPKFNPNRRRGSVQTKAMYSNSLGGYFLTEDEVLDKSSSKIISDTNIYDIKVKEMISIDGIDYIKIQVIYLKDMDKIIIYRRQEEINSLNNKICCLNEVDNNLLPKLPSLKFNRKTDLELKYHLSNYELYLIDVEAYLWDLLYFNNSLLNLNLEIFLKETEIDRNIHISLKFNLSLLKPIQIGPSFEKDLMNLSFSKNIQVNKTSNSNNHHEQQLLLQQQQMSNNSIITNKRGSFKIKLQIDDNLFAYYLKQDPISYQEFLTSITDYLGFTNFNLQYKHLKSNQILPLQNEQQFLNAINESNKNYLYVLAKF
ncbi:hypothetical protein K502DRAFT_341501 [Neoconidiobolus thromboides FSU 785]|nr:hypothetical protein K502DRAFT_341501 [Neoconidiobolus thromboides FSU 785]